MEKYDKTRLKNLLEQNRAHFITQYRNKFPHIRIVRVIELVDNSINIILAGI